MTRGARARLHPRLISKIKNALPDIVKSAVRHIMTGFQREGIANMNELHKKAPQDYRNGTFNRSYDKSDLVFGRSTLLHTATIESSPP